MLYSATHMATVGVKGSKSYNDYNGAVVPSYQVDTVLLETV